MLNVHCICVGMGSINVVSYISILEKEGNISVIMFQFQETLISFLTANVIFNSDKSMFQMKL